MIIQPPLTITNPGREFLLNMIFGAGQDLKGLLCSEGEAFDTEEGLSAQHSMEDKNYEIVQE